MSKYQEDVEFLNSVLKPRGIVGDTQKFMIGKVDWRKFMKNHGVTKEVLDQVVEAQNTCINSSIKLATQKLKEVEDGVDKVSISIHTDMGKYDARVSKKVVEGHNPKTGEKVRRFGEIKVAVAVKPVFDEEVIEHCKKQIEDLIK